MCLVFSNDTPHRIAPTFSNFDLGGAKCRQNGARVRLAKQDELDWWRVHLAMRSHRFSGVHGPPVTDLNKITIRLRGLWTSSTEAVVHDDHLLLKVEGFRLVGRNEDYTRHMPCCKHLKTSSAMAHELRRIHDAFFECIARATSDEACPALSTDASSSSSTTTPTDTTTTVPPSTTTQPPTAATTNTTDPPPWPPNPTSPPFSLRDAHNRPSMLYRCASCPFEFRLRIGRGDAFRSEAADIVWRNRDLRHDRRGDGYMLCISGYADLGPCVDPAEPRWTALAADVVGPATVLAAGSGSNARASVNASSGPSSTGSGFAAQHKARTSSPAGVNAPHPSGMARSRSRVGSASAPDLKSGRHGKGAHVTPVALPLPQRPVEEFHRPTIESRFEHHNSLRPLDFDEVAVSIGASVGG